MCQSEIKSSEGWDGKMAQGVQAVAPKFDDLSIIYRTYVVATVN